LGSTAYYLINLSPAKQILNDNTRTDVTFINSSREVHTFNVEVAMTEKSRETGLMNRNRLANDSGMLFVFPKSDYLSFWMKNTQVSLDIIFLDDQQQIVKIYKQTTPLQEFPSYDSQIPAKYAIELSGGSSDKYGLMVGDSVVF
jgi:hypothetical protein